MLRAFNVVIGILMGLDMLIRAVDLFLTLFSERGIVGGNTKAKRGRVSVKDGRRRAQQQQQRTQRSLQEPRPPRPALPEHLHF